MSYLHELVLEVFKAVEADGRHVSVLHGNCPLGLLVLTEEREVLKIMLRKFIYHCNIQITWRQNIRRKRLVEILQQRLIFNWKIFYWASALGGAAAAAARSQAHCC